MRKNTRIQLVVCIILSVLILLFVGSRLAYESRLKDNLKMQQKIDDYERQRAKFERSLHE